MDLLLIIYSILIFPIAFFLGIIYSFFLRKVYARFQARRGPWLIVPKEVRKALGLSRILQPLYDALKLLYKESLIPEAANKKLFKSTPYIILGSIILSISFIPIAGFSPLGSFKFSLIVILYLLLIPPLLLVIGGSSSSSPWGVIGAKREVELTLIYEIIQAFAVFSVAIAANSLSIFEIIEFQKNHRPFIALNPLAAIAFLLVIIGKLKVKPFDIPDAPVEVVAGPETEYSGKLLGVLELGRIFFIFISITLFIDLFLEGGMHLIPSVSFIIESLAILFILALINAVNPRYRLDQAFKWCLKYQIPIAIAAIAWTYILKWTIVF
ncbi:NADH-quinone oxidoreductase subunit H [Candidatus Bathyarchaeota archaeon]|nr:NADH-quinone oxidoreductase subunit H [Candidatus Bathyarchaeota archaeon]